MTPDDAGEEPGPSPAEDDSDAADGPEDSEPDAEASSEAGADSKEGKKKGKKKRKKKKSMEGQSPPVPGVPSPQQLNPGEKAANDRRFVSALEDLRSNASDNLWIKLGACNIYDGKARKLAGALKRNKEVTLLDLSGNNITDGGAEALVNALEAGGAPQLIVLDLRDNPISSAGLALLEAVQAARKDLKIESGRLISLQEAAVSSVLADGEAMPTAMMNGNAGGGARSQFMLERYFQVSKAW